MNDRHRVFVSYYHCEDQGYRERFENLFVDIHDIMVLESVEIGEIVSNLPPESIQQIIREGYLRDSTVTVVLIGAHTWQRKFVDWEISASIRETKNSPRSGLLGILLPTYPGPTDDPNTYCIETIPPRLYDNIQCGFSDIFNWSDDPQCVRSWIHNAFKWKKKIPPNNSRELFKNNRSDERWRYLEDPAAFVRSLSSRDTE